MISQPGLARPQQGARHVRTDQSQSSTDPLGIGYSRDDLLTAAREIQARLIPFGRDGELVLSMFSKLTLHSVSAQTIFGTKPLSEFYLQSGELPPEQTPATWITTTEFEAWQRVSAQARLVSSYLVIREADSELLSGAGKVLLTYNANNVRDIFARHGERFKEKLGHDISADTIIELLHTARDFRTLFSGDHELKGIIIGYGQVSSAAYSRLVALCDEGDLGPLTRAQIMKDRMARAALPETFPREEFVTLLEALEVTAAPHQLPNSVSFRPHREDHESHDLLQKYHSTARALIGLAEQHGQEVVAQIALARWCGRLP